MPLRSILGRLSVVDQVLALADFFVSFIVLEHDLFEITVDLAIGYTLDAALAHNPPFTVSIYSFDAFRS